MKVIKRSGRTEEFFIEKVKKKLDKVKYLLNNKGLDIDVDKIIEISANTWYDGISTIELNNVLITSMESLITIDEYGYNNGGGILSIIDSYHEVLKFHNIDFTAKDNPYEKLTLVKYVKENISSLNETIKNYTDDDLEFFDKHINVENDYLFTITGFRFFKERTIVKKGTIATELPQHVYMLTAMAVAGVEEKSIRNEWVLRFYNALSHHHIALGSPNINNSRLYKGNTASCAILNIPDKADGILNGVKEVGLGNKHGVGFGGYLGNLRGSGAPIGGVDNANTSPILFLGIFNSTISAFNQSGKRNGVFNATFPIWHLDVDAFIEMSNDGVDSRYKNYDLTTSISFQNMFIERYKNDGLITLFDPYDVRGLDDLYGDEFKEHYEHHEKRYLDNPDEYNKATTQIPIKPLIDKWLTAWVIDSNKCLPFFHDNANLGHENSELGTIKSPNLCMEELVPVKEGDKALCNLGAVTLNKVLTDQNNFELFDHTVETLVRFLDNVIDAGSYITKHEKTLQLKRRSIGAGVLGEALAIGKLGIKYGSNEHKLFINKLYYRFEQVVANYSLKLGEEKGSCPVCKLGLRNAYRTTLMPNSNSGLIVNSSPSFEQVFDSIWSYESHLGVSTISYQEINSETKDMFPTRYEVSPDVAIELTAIRQKYIDKGISFSLNIPDPTITVITLAEYVFKSIELGLKSMYYLRFKNNVTEEEIDDDEINYDEVDIISWEHTGVEEETVAPNPSCVVDENGACINCQ
jgi:ribonucleoside-diphosphate reductase alpha chain